MDNPADVVFMQEALNEAYKAREINEVPVGAVLVYEGKIIARSYNRMISLQDPSAHAEILVLRMAGAVLSNYRLLNTTLYATLEPCLMCFSALVQARIKRLVFGAFDPKTGVCGSAFDAKGLDFFNHCFECTSGVMQQECGTLLREFFEARRKIK